LRTPSAASPHTDVDVDLRPVEREEMAGMAIDRIAVLIPGANYSVDCPLLFYAGLAASRRGAEVVPISWPRPLPNDEELPAWVHEQVCAALGAARPLLIGKSVGTLAAGLAADLGLPAVWLTPLLTEQSVVGDLGRATAPALLIGGTADKAWDGGTARAISGHVMEIPDADHGLHVPGSIGASVRLAADIMDNVEHFLDTLVWTG
jgi:hypothetical protein